MIEQSFARAGWELDYSFSEYLIIGHNGDGLSILAYPQAREPEEDPVFELIDHESNLTYGVQEIPSPRGYTVAPGARPATRGGLGLTTSVLRGRLQRAAGGVRGYLLLPTCIGSYLLV